MHDLVCRIRSVAPPEVLQIVFFAEEGSWIVGGALRDLCLDQDPKDWDLVVEAQAWDRLSQELRWIVLDAERGVARVPLDKGSWIDVSLFKGETILEDLGERDFTCNAMAWNPKEGLLDPFGGRASIRDKLLSEVSDRIFDEDPIRWWRMLRFLEGGWSLSKDLQHLSQKLLETSPAWDPERWAQNFWEVLHWELWPELERWGLEGCLGWLVEGSVSGALGSDGAGGATLEAEGAISASDFASGSDGATSADEGVASVDGRVSSDEPRASGVVFSEGDLATSGEDFASSADEDGADGTILTCDLASAGDPHVLAGGGTLSERIAPLAPWASALSRSEQNLVMLWLVSGGDFSRLASIRWSREQKRLWSCFAHWGSWESFLRTLLKQRGFASPLIALWELERGRVEGPSFWEPLLEWIEKAPSASFWLEGAGGLRGAELGSWLEEQKIAWFSERIPFERYR